MAAIFELTVGFVAGTVALWHGPSVSTLKDVPGCGSLSFRWAAKYPFVEYAVCVVPAGVSGHDTSVPVGSAHGSVNIAGTGSFAANSPMETTLTAADLQAADDVDGAKIVKVFVKTADGLWSI